jgi:hypothetical protein
VSTERALDILHMEAKDGMLDKDLLKVFVDGKVFDIVSRASGEHRVFR